MPLPLTPEEALFPKPSPEELTQWLKSALEELRLTTADLAFFMTKNKDHRDVPTVMRGIQRMLSGESRVSGEMAVIVNMLIRQRRRLADIYPNIEWHRNEHGTYSAQIENWFVYISPQSRGRWVLSCSRGNRHENFSPPFGRWLNSLEEAKSKALVCVEEGMNEWAEIDYRDR